MRHYATNVKHQENTGGEEISPADLHFVGPSIPSESELVSYGFARFLQGCRWLLRIREATKRFRRLFMNTYINQFDFKQQMNGFGHLRVRDLRIMSANGLRIPDCIENVFNPLFLPFF